MENFMEVMAIISIMFTAIMMLILNVIEDRQEKKEAKLREAKSAHDKVKKEWEELENKK